MAVGLRLPGPLDSRADVELLGELACLPGYLGVAPVPDPVADPPVDLGAVLAGQQSGLRGHDGGSPLADLPAGQGRSVLGISPTSAVASPRWRPPRCGLSRRARAIWCATPRPCRASGTPAAACRSRTHSATRAVSRAYAPPTHSWCARPRRSARCTRPRSGLPEPARPAGPPTPTPPPRPRRRCQRVPGLSTCPRRSHHHEHRERHQTWPPTTRRPNTRSISDCETSARSFSGWRDQPR